MDINEMVFPEILPWHIPYSTENKEIAKQIAKKIGYTINTRRHLLIAPFWKKAIYTDKILREYTNHFFTVSANQRIDYSNRANICFSIDSQRCEFSQLPSVSIVTITEKSEINNPTEELDNYVNNQPDWLRSIDMSWPNHISVLNTLIRSSATGTFTEHIASWGLRITIIVNWQVMRLRESNTNGRLITEESTLTAITQTTETIQDNIFMDTLNGNILKTIWETEWKLLFNNMLINNITKISKTTIENTPNRLIKVKSEENLAQYIIQTLKEAHIETEKFCQTTRTYQSILSLY